MSLKPMSQTKDLNDAEQDKESFREVCLMERPDQLKFFLTRFVKDLGKDGVMEATNVAKEYDAKVGTQKEFAVVSTEFTDFISSQKMEFASMKDRKVAFKDLDIDGNAHISLIELLVYMNKDMILKSSEGRWGVLPPSSGEDYMKAVLREMFLPAVGFEKGFDSSLIEYVTLVEGKEKEKADLEASKEGLGGVKIRNVEANIKKIDQELEAAKKNFDRDLPKTDRILTKAQKALEKIEGEIAAEAAAADARGGGKVKERYPGN